MHSVRIRNGTIRQSQLTCPGTNKVFAVKCNGNDEHRSGERMKMTRAIEVVYENNVFKPLVPVEGIKEHERMVAILSRRPVKKGLR
ncbi:MAG: antitoxin family protein, partial [Minisyncoccia bacterium]